MKDFIRLQQGCGGKPTDRLIKEVFYKHFHNEILLQGFDSALLSIAEQKAAFTTDSFIIRPHFFSGGDIGKLAVCGTVNDLAVCGAKPLYLSCAVILEEGYPLESLERIARSMAETAGALSLTIATGDTKVVEKGFADGIYINTSGIGVIMEGYSSKTIKEGDAILISGGIGEHGAAIAVERYGIKTRMSLRSDCAPVFPIIEQLREYSAYIKLMKDPTRGGVATALNEIAEKSGLGIRLSEEKVPIKPEVGALCEMLGLEPMYLACEGRVIFIVAKEKASMFLESLRKLEGCEDAAIIGSFVNEFKNMVYSENVFGGSRIISSLEADLLPRIC